MQGWQRDFAESEKSVKIVLFEDLMADNFQNIIEHLIMNEGGYVNHPMDPGGATIWGVTLRNWRAYTGRKVSKEEFKALQQRDVKEFYETQYWDKVNANLLPSGLDYCVFDFAVNSGVSRSAKLLQKLVGVIQDGDIGKHTLRAVGEYIMLKGEEDNKGLKYLIDVFMYERKDFLRKLKTFPVFGKGWFNRIEKVKQRSYTLIKTVYIEPRSIEQSRTIKAAKKQVIAATATGIGVASEVTLPDVSQVVSDLQTVNTLASGVSSLMSYGIYVALAFIVIYALYQIYFRNEDWFMGDRP